MQTYYLDPAQELDETHRKLCEIVDQMSEENANVFSMWVDTGEAKYQFETTNKDLFLFLGRMGEGYRRTLLKVLLKQLGGVDRMLFQFRKKEKDPTLCTKKSMVVSRTSEAGLTTISLAPA